MTVKFGVETVEGIAVEAAPLFVKHHSEAGFVTEHLEPDFEAFLALEDRGFLRVFTARKHGVLVGYAVFCIRKSPHYGYLEGVLELLYITPKERGFGLRFIPWCERQLKKQKVKRMFLGLPMNRNFHPFMKRLGYAPVQVTFTKRL